MIKVKKKHDLYSLIVDEYTVFIVQDYVYYLMTYLKHTNNYLASYISGASGMNGYIVDSWMAELDKQVASATLTADAIELLNNLEIINFGIIFGVREYQIKNDIHSMLVDRKYDDEYRADKKPFELFVDENNNINYVLSDDLYKSLVDCVKFIKDFNTSNINEVIIFYEKMFVFDNDYYTSCLKNILEHNQETDIYKKYKEIFEEVAI